MHKSTYWLAVIVVGLALASGVTAWQLMTSQTAAEPRVEGTAIELSIPGIRPADSQTTQFQVRSALLWNRDTHTIGYEQHGFERVPIASITKLMTAMVALDHGLQWDQVTTIEPREYSIGGQLLLHPGESLTVRDLFYASLLGSANNATRAYVRSLGITESDFVLAMNRKAVELGLEQTFFTDVTGLDKGNVSTAYDVARMAEAAFSDYPEIAAATAGADYTFILSGSGREHTIRNTNKLVSDNQQVFTGSKTGFLYEAGYCLVVQGSGALAGRIAVVLGAETEELHFSEVIRLLTMTSP